MASPDVTALQRSDLNQFLFADIGTEANGMTLSVMSVFARRGTDPWTEAGRLAILPKADAAESLARMIVGMPKSLWSPPDASVIAERLIGLLPSRPATLGIRAGGIRAGGIRAGGIRQLARRWPNGQIVLVLSCVAMIITIITMMMKQ